MVWVYSALLTLQIFTLKQFQNNRANIMNHTILGISAALVSAASWALGSILFNRIGKKMNAFGMTLAKGVIATLMLGAVYMIEGAEPVIPKTAIILAISGFIGISIGDTLFFASLQYLGPKVQISFFMLGQVITAMLGIFILRELPFLLQWIGIGVTLTGVAIVLWKKVDSEQTSQKTVYRGIILGLLSMLCFSFSLILAKQAMYSVSSITAVFVRMAAGAAGIFIYGVFKRQVKYWISPFRDSGLILSFIIAVIIISFGGFWLSMYSVANIDIVLASVLGSTEPLFVLVLAFFISRERITLPEFIGATLTVIGVVIIVRGSGPG
jgi:drug/metabolite transporter (DMT)-like permease